MADAPDKDIAKDGLLAIAPRDPSGRPTLGGIPLYKKLGQGGMGAVYLGKHPRLGVEVAVKILPFHLADQDPNAIEYFMREANVAARLNHPNLVRIFDVNVDGDPKSGSAIWYLVMEFVSGKTAGRMLKDRMKSGQGPLSEAEALDILLTVSDGLAAAHEQRFVHRDIKPENIIIPAGPDGELQFRKAKLMDLGLAKAHSEELSLGPTGTNVAMGTPGYMAPEQAENAKGAGPPADVFAMGATLYNFLTGSAPFTGTTVLNVLKKTSDEAHVPLRQVNPAVSRPTEILVDTCLSKRPEARYAAAGVLREALKACRQSLVGEVSTELTLASLQNLASIAPTDPTIRADAPSVVPSGPPRTAATAKTAATPGRRSKVPIMAALALIAAAGVGGFLLWQGRTPGTPNPTPPAAGGNAFDAALRDAEAAMAQEDYDRAESLFAKARGLNPKSEAASAGEIRARRLKEKESSAATAGGAGTEIQAAIDRGDWDTAERLLAQVKPEERESFRASIDHGRKRMDRIVRDEYDSECDRALEEARSGRFDEARKRLAAAEGLQPAGTRHGPLKDEIRHLEHLSDARRLLKDGRNTDALASAMKALALRGDSADARSLIETLRKEGPLALAQAALASGDPALAARHAREAATLDAASPELKTLENELWADLYVEKAAAAAKGPVDELMSASDGRIVGLGAGFGSYAVWSGDDLKPQVTPASGSRPFHAALIEKEGLQVAGLTTPPGPDGPEAQPVVVWEEGRRRPLESDISGMKIPLKATRLAPFDGGVVIRILWTAGDDRGPDVYSVDLLDTERAAAGNSTSNRAQAHASIAVPAAGGFFATGGGIYRTWKREGNRVVVDERKADTQVYVWSRDTFAKRPVDLGEAVGEGALLAFTPDGATLLVATAARKLFVIDAAAGRVDRTIVLPGAPTSLSASPSRAAVVAGRRVHLVRLDDARVAPASSMAPARSVLCSADGVSVYVGGEDGILRRYAFEPLAK